MLRHATVFSRFGLLTWLIVMMLAGGAPESRAAGPVLFTTAFERNEGYVTGPALSGQNGWLNDGSGGNGLVSGFFSGQGQQGYIGYGAPSPADSASFLWVPVNAKVSRAQFSVSMAIIDSTNHVYDDFLWGLYNRQGDSLVMLDFDNVNLEIYYSLDAGATYTDTHATFANSTIYPLVMNFNFASNRWDATLNGLLVATNVPISISNAPLDLGDIDAVWLYGASAGNNYMLFDNYKITAEGAPFAFTEPPNAITAYGAALNGMATPNGLSSTAWFEWGTNFGFQQTTAPIPVGVGSNVVWVSTNITGLIGGGVYQDRLVVSNASGITRGANRQFILGGHVYAWAGNLTSDTNVPAGLDTATAIAAGGGNSIALKTDGSVVQWGGIANKGANGLSNIVGVAAGSAHYLALKNDGKVMAWGDNVFPASFGQTNVPPNLTNVVAVAAGVYHSLALRKDGTIAVWGGDNVSNVPPNLSNVVMIANGNGYHSEVIKNDGTIVSWGGSIASANTNPPAGLATVADGATGVYANTAVKNSGSVIVWGTDDGGDSQTNVPSGFSNVLAAAGGYYHSLVLKPDGTLRGWGRNDVGQSSIPSQFTNVVAISAGGSHDVIIKPPLSPPPLNDNFLNAFVITGTSVTFAGTNVNATKEPGEPQHDGYAGGSSIWWKWTAPADGVVSVSLQTSSFNPVIAMYQGTNLSNLTPVGGDLSAITYVPVTSNTVYYVAVDRTTSATGTISLSLSEITTPTNDQCSGAIAMAPGILYSINTVAATSTGDPIPSCTGTAANGVWYQFTSPTNAEVTLNSCGSAIGTVLAVYSGNCGALTPVSGACNSGYGPFCFGSQASLAFSASAGVTYWILMGGTYGGTGNLSIIAYVYPLLKINCPSDISVFTAADAPPPDPTLVQIASPGCGGVTRTFYSDQNFGTYIIRTYRATDTCGQVQYCTQTINLTCRPPHINSVSYVDQSVQTDGIHLHFYANVSPNVSSYNWQVTSGTYISTSNDQNGNFDVVVSPTNTSVIQVQLVSVSGPCGLDSNSQSGTGAPNCSFCLSHGTPSALAGTTGSGSSLTATGTCAPLGANTRWYRMIASETGPITVSGEGSSNVNQIAICAGPSLAALTNISCVIKPQTRVTFNALSNVVYWFAVDPGTNSPSGLRVASGFEPVIQTFGMTNGVFKLLSTIAPPITYKVIGATNPAIPLSNWSVVLSTNWNSNYPYNSFRVDYSESNFTKFPSRFYRLAPGP